MERISVEFVEQIVGVVTGELSRELVQEVFDGAVLREALVRAICRDTVESLTHNVVLELVTDICG